MVFIMILKENNRIAIFAFYDADGIVDEYIKIILKSIKPFCKKILIVVNGFLSEKGKEQFSEIGEILIRENKGLDITGYKEAFLYLWNKGEIKNCEEVLFFNQTVMGPVWPFEDMFSKMNTEDVDFWGMTEHKEGFIDVTGKGNIEKMTRHIQSYFFAVRGRMLSDGELKNYWENLPEITNYKEAVGLHEIKFTKYFEDRGYKWKTYIDTKDMESYIDYPLMNESLTVVKDRKCPVFKRKSLIVPSTDYFIKSIEKSSNGLYNWLKESNNYDISMALENAFRTSCAYDVNKALLLNYEANGNIRYNDETALVIWIDGKEHTKELLEQVDKALSENAKVIVITNDKFKSEYTLKKAEVFDSEGKNGIEILFTKVWGQIKDKKYLVYLHNHSINILDDVLKDDVVIGDSIDLILNTDVISEFEKDKNIGLIVPDIPYQNEHYINSSVTVDKIELKNVAEKANIKISEKENILSMPEGMFAARIDAVKPLNEIEWDKNRQFLFDGKEAIAYLLLPLTSFSQKYLMLTSYNSQKLWFESQHFDKMRKFLGENFSKGKYNREDLIMHRIKGISDFYDERCDQMTLQQAFSGNLKIKEKLYIIYHLFFG